VAETGAPELKKSISFSVLILLAINAIIGTGIFFVPGIASAIAGPASIISWIAVAVIAMLIAACFAELVGMFPKAGGVYEYTKQAFGEFGGFIVGWTSWLVANVTIAMLAIGCLAYMAAFFPILAAPSPEFGFYLKIFIALLIVALINTVSFRGVDLSVKMLVVFSIITIMSLWTLISWGVYYFDFGRIQMLDMFPKVSLVIAMVYILETFFGWETVANLAEETKDAKRVIPKVMMWGTLAVTFLAIGVVSIALGSVGWYELSISDAPLILVANTVMGTTGGQILTFLIFLNIFGGAAAWIITTPRLIFALARDGLLPKALQKIHPKFQTPYIAILVQAVLSGLIILSGSYKILLELVLPLAIFMYAMVVMSVTILRFTQPNTERTFRVPFGKSLPVILGLTLMFLMGGIDPVITGTGAMFVLLGIPLYLMRTVESKPLIVQKLLDSSAFLQKISYNLFVKPKTHKHILKHFEGFENRKIINIGASSGELAKDLSKLVGPGGHILATDVSAKRLRQATKLAKKHNLENVEFILEDSEARHNLHQKVHSLHGATSIGLLGYLSEPEKVLKALSLRMTKKGRIYFIDYDRVFKIFRAPEWLQNDKEIQKIFDDVGFRVTVRRDKGFFWDTLHIVGWKYK
jgi:amino acid transporter